MIKHTLERFRRFILAQLNMEAMKDCSCEKNFLSILSSSCISSQSGFMDLTNGKAPNCPIMFRHIVAVFVMVRQKEILGKLSTFLLRYLALMFHFRIFGFKQVPSRFFLKKQFVPGSMARILQGSCSISFCV